MFIPNLIWLANWHLLWNDPMFVIFFRDFVLISRIFFYSCFIICRCFLGLFGTLWCFWWVRKPKFWFQVSVLRLFWLQMRLHYPIVKYMAGRIACRLKPIQRKCIKGSKNRKKVQKKSWNFFAKKVQFIETVTQQR